MCPWAKSVAGRLLQHTVQSPMRISTEARRLSERCAYRCCAPLSQAPKAPRREGGRKAVRCAGERCRPCPQSSTSTGRSFSARSSRASVRRPAISTMSAARWSLCGAAIDGGSERYLPIPAQDRGPRRCAAVGWAHSAASSPLVGLPRMPAEREIQAMVDRETEAWNARDAEALVSLFHPGHGAATAWRWRIDRNLGTLPSGMRVSILESDCATVRQA